MLRRGLLTAILAAPAVIAADRAEAREPRAGRPAVKWALRVQAASGTGDRLYGPYDTETAATTAGAATGRPYAVELLVSPGGLGCTRERPC